MTKALTTKPSPYPPWQSATTGRPTLYDPAYCDVVVDHATTTGHCSHATVASLFDVAKATVQEWERERPEFAAALNRARAKAEAYWEARYAETALTNGKSLAQGYACFDMKNRFGWADQRDVHMQVQHIHSPARVAYDQHAKQLKADAIDVEYTEVEGKDR